MFVNHSHVNKWKSKKIYFAVGDTVCVNRSTWTTSWWHSTQTRLRWSSTRSPSPPAASARSRDIINGETDATDIENRTEFS